MIKKTAMQELKEKLQHEAERLKDAEPGTDPYGYKGAMENIVKDIDAQMMEKEKQQIIDARATLYAELFSIHLNAPRKYAEGYYTKTYLQ